MRKKKNGKLLLGVLVAVVCLGIGYASVAGINLLVNGSATVKANGDFIVRFVRPLASEDAIESPETNAILKSGKKADNTDMNVSNLTASIVDDTTATFGVSEMTTVGDYAEFTYTVVNKSDAIDAMLSFEVAGQNNDAEEYFEITKTVDKAIIGVGETAKVKVRVTLIKLPKVDDVEGTFTVTLTASPEDVEDISGDFDDVTGTQGVSSATAFAKAIQNEAVDTISLDDDITITKKANLTITDDTTIEFNGNRLTVEPESIKVADGATLTLTDENGDGGISSTNNAIVVKSGGEVVVESGTYETTEFTGRGAVIRIAKGEDNAKITIDGGTLNGDYFAIASYANSEIEINGGVMNSTATVKNGADETGRTYHAYAVKLDAGHITMNGGEINGVHGGLALEGSSSATINNGTITLNNSYEGAKDSYYCLYVNGNASAEVNNGTFINNGTNPLVYSSSTGMTNLRGGAWTAKAAKAFNGATDSGKDVIKVYGGTYKKNTNGTLTDYDLTGYTAN